MERLRQQLHIVLAPVRVDWDLRLARASDLNSLIRVELQDTTLSCKKLK